MHVILASVPHVGHIVASAASSTGVHTLEIGLLFGVGVALLAPRWITGIVVIIALAIIGGIHFAHHISSKDVSYALVAGAALVIGLIWGRIRGLRHLGEADFNTRLTAIRRISRW
jgi:protein-S-isoprenylcysteine O-methyltransferase Ste14